MAYLSERALEKPCKDCLRNLKNIAKKCKDWSERFSTINTRINIWTPLRAFDENIKREMREKQMGICAGASGVKYPHKNKKLDTVQMQDNYIVPCSKGGKITIYDYVETGK